ncbi:hypothetical protein GGD38_003582 [Chitinophagaceae bacterium OAS944]|nr:hypothetical protein [Chitinophagaceae bacterium OAS944]
MDDKDLWKFQLQKKLTLFGVLFLVGIIIIFVATCNA